MKKTILSFILIGLTLISCCKPEIIGNVPNNLQPQQTGNWCWAATTQMIAQHFGITVTQCSLANYRFGKSNCCDSETSGVPCPKTDDCNNPDWPQLDYVGLKFTESAAALSWEKLQKQIFCAKKPMAYAYGGIGVGHVLVIKGYLTLNGTRYLVLNDPWSPCVGEERIITYEQYADPAGAATHWSTIYDIAKK